MGTPVFTVGKPASSPLLVVPSTGQGLVPPPPEPAAPLLPPSLAPEVCPPEFYTEGWPNYWNASEYHTHDQYAHTGHVHPYAALLHTHDFALPDHAHAYAPLDHTHNIQTPEHEHPYAALYHGHMEYASAVHAHDGMVSSTANIIAGMGMYGGGSFQNGDITLNVGVGDGLGVDAGAVYLLAPGTLTYQSANVAAGAHTHDLDSDWDVTGGKSKLLHSQAGALWLDEMRAATQVVTPKLFSTTDITIDAQTGLVVFDYDDTLKSDNFLAGFPLAGWRFAPSASNAGTSVLQVGRVESDEMAVRVFVADTARVDIGLEYHTKGYAHLSREFVVPAVGAATTIHFENSPHFLDRIFSEGDWVLFRYLEMGGGIVATSVWGQVYNYAAVGSTEQSYSFYARQGGVGLTIRKGSPGVNFGSSGQAYLLTDAVSGTSPSITMGRWSGANPYTAANRKVHVAVGHLGAAGFSTEYGIAASQGGTWLTTDSWFKSGTGGTKFNNIDAEWYNAGTLVARIRSTGNPIFWVGKGAKYFQFDGTNVTWAAGNSSIDASGNLTASNATLSGTMSWATGRGRISDVGIRMVMPQGLWTGAEQAAMSMTWRDSTVDGTVVIGLEPWQDAGGSAGLWMHYGSGAAIRLTNGAGSYFPVDISGDTRISGNLTLTGYVTGTLNAQDISATNTIYAAESINSPVVYMGGRIVMGRNSSNYFAADNWIQWSNNSGLYWPSSGSGTHFAPQTGQFGSFVITGSKNTYAGLLLSSAYGAINIMWSTSGVAGGFYNTNGPNWPLYYDGTNWHNTHNTTTGGKFWTQGNDGAGSGLDADLLDGLHANELGRYIPLTPFELVDTGGQTWNGSGRAIGTHYFDLNHSWNGSLPAGIKAVVVLIVAQWAGVGANGAYYASVASSGAPGSDTALTVRSISNSWPMDAQGIVNTSGGDIQVVIGGAAATAVWLRIIGYFM